MSSSINTIEVFPLKYADAKALADLVKELFPSASTPPVARAALAAGFGRFGGAGGAAVDAAAAVLAVARKAALVGWRRAGRGRGRREARASRIAATSDDHSNSLIVSAPEDLIPTIRDLVEKLDQPVEDVTEVRMFHLQHRGLHGNGATC